MATATSAFLPRIMMHLSKYPENDNVMLDAIRDAVRELCMVAPVFRRLKTWTPAQSEMDPIADGDDLDGDRAASYKLSGVRSVRVGGYDLRRRNSLEARQEPWCGGATWDTDGDRVYLSGFRPPAATDYVFAQPPGGAGRSDIYSPTAPSWAGASSFAAGTAVRHLGAWYTARRDIGPDAAANTEPAPGGDANWSPGATDAAQGWRRLMRGNVPEGWEILNDLRGGAQGAEIEYSVHPPRSWENIADEVFENYAAAVAAGALARLPMVFYQEGTPQGMWTQRWQSELGAAARRLVGVGERRTRDNAPHARAFSQTPYF